jgi:hypothetical protein
VEQESTLTIAEELPKAENDLCEIDLQQVRSPVLTRLIEEVRNEELSPPSAYNRYHNRHNRSR